MIHKHNNDGMKIHAARKMNNIENQCGEKGNVVIYLADALSVFDPGKVLGCLTDPFGEFASKKSVLWRMFWWSYAQKVGGELGEGGGGVGEKK